MSTFVSPEVKITEKSESLVISTSASTNVGQVGEFEQGPAFDIENVSSVQTLISTFGNSTSSNENHWWSTWNFLQYANTLNLVRVVGKTSTNAGLAFIEKEQATTTPVETTTTRLNISDEPTIAFELNAKIQLYYKWVGTKGNDYKVGVVNYEDFNTIKLDVSTVSGPFTVGETVTGGTSGAKGTVVVYDAVDSFVKVKNVFGEFETAETITGTTSTETATIDAITGKLEVITGVTYDSIYDFELESDDLLIVVLDSNDEILETNLVSITPGKLNAQGDLIYINSFLENSSQYLYGYDNTDEPNLPASVSATSLLGGTLVDPTTAEIQEGFDFFKNPEETDIFLLIDGGYAGDATIQKYMVQSIAEFRKDIRCILSPARTDIVNISTLNQAVENTIDYFINSLSVASSYYSFYGNWKNQYDSYNQKYVWNPISADIAGLKVNAVDLGTAGTGGWGYTRGLIKSTNKLAINPDKTQRDSLWKAGINSVIKDGTRFVNFGNLTGNGKNDLFNNAEIRDLFNAFKKNIKEFAIFTLGEKNIVSTQRNFKNRLDNYFNNFVPDDIDEFRTVTGDTVNTPTIKEQGIFKAVCAIKPANIIRYVDLILTAVGASVDIEEVIR